MRTLREFKRDRRVMTDVCNRRNLVEPEVHGRFMPAVRHGHIAPSMCLSCEACLTLVLVESK